MYKEKTKKCRVCGCTDNRACNPPCSWVEDDLCSSCVDIDNKCHICGLSGDDHELVKCINCGKMVCAENDHCVEILGQGEEFPTCTKCIATYTLYDCEKCFNQGKEMCPCDGYSSVYDCPEYIENTEELKFELHIKEIIALEIDISPYEVEDQCTLKEVLGVDSLDAIMIVMEIEEAYPCLEISDSEAAEFENKTVKDLIDLLFKKTTEKKEETK